MAKRLRDMEVSWALGASYDLINTLYQTESKPLIDDLKNDTDELRVDGYAVDCLRFVANQAFSVLAFFNFVS